MYTHIHSCQWIRCDVAKVLKGSIYSPPSLSVTAAAAAATVVFLENVFFTSYTFDLYKKHAVSIYRTRLFRKDCRTNN